MTDAPRAPDFDRFHREELPRLVAAGHGALAAPALGREAPLAVALADGRSYTYRPAAGTVEIVAGTRDAAVALALAPGAWEDLLAERRTIPGLLYQDRLTIERGDVAAAMRWEPALRALYHGRPVYDPARLALVDRDGAPLDLGATFTLGATDTALRHFLERAGFAVVRDVLAAAEIAALTGEVRRLAAAARRGDRTSWWARSASGTDVLCRVTYAGLRSTAIAAVADDPRIRALAALIGADLRPAPDRMDGTAVIMKRPAIVAGLADLPWHVDCGMGGHPLMCPVAQISVLLSAATPETGTLQFLAGSHRFAAPAPTDEASLPIATVRGEAGDCVVHLSDTMHAAPPPRGTGAVRSSLVVSFYRPAVLDLVPAGHAFNDVLFGDDGRVESLQAKARARHQ